MDNKKVSLELQKVYWLDTAGFMNEVHLPVYSIKRKPLLPPFFSVFWFRTWTQTLSGLFLFVWLRQSDVLSRGPSVSMQGLMCVACKGSVVCSFSCMRRLLFPGNCPLSTAGVASRPSCWTGSPAHVPVWWSVQVGPAEWTRHYRSTVCLLNRVAISPSVEPLERLF